MNVQWKKLILLTCAAFVLVSCGPKKTEEALAPEQKQVAPLIELKKPESASPSEQQLNKEGKLTPEQKDELRIDEDNVINPFPG